MYKIRAAGTSVTLLLKYLFRQEFYFAHRRSFRASSSQTDTAGCRVSVAIRMSLYLPANRLTQRVAGKRQCGRDGRGDEVGIESTRLARRTTARSL